jgi:hypothetical protein
MDVQDSLRATSDSLMRDLEVLSTLEEEKRNVKPDDPRLAGLAERIEEIARRVLATTVHQHGLADEINADPHAGADGASIEETRRPVAAVLAEWRDAERRASTAAPGTPEASEASAQVDALRAEYRRAYEAARRAP